MGARPAYMLFGATTTFKDTAEANNQDEKEIFYSINKVSPKHLPVNLWEI